MEVTGVHSVARDTAQPTVSSAERPPPLPAGRKIKVVHLLHTIAYGGVETIIINWFKALRSLPAPAIDLSLVCFENPGHTEQPFLDVARKEGLTVPTIPWSRRKPVFSSGLKLARILRAERAQILHTHNTYADLTGLVAAKLTGVKTVSSAYVWSDFGWKRNLLQWINERALRSFDCVAAQCRATLQHTCARGIPPAKVRLLPSGLDLNPNRLSSIDRREQRKTFGADDRDIVLVNAARLYPEKAQAQLLQITRQIVNLHPNVKLWILGVGPLENELRALAHHLNLEAHVRFLGFSDDLNRILELADVHVHPSRAEGIPMALLSGMACALPVVASNVGGIPEVLEDGVAGLLTPPADHPDFERAFAAAVLDLIRNPGRRLALGAQAARVVQTGYSMEAAIHRLEELYRDVLVS